MERGNRLKKEKRKRGMEFNRLESQSEHWSLTDEEKEDERSVTEQAGRQQWLLVVSMDNITESSAALWLTGNRR